MSYAGLLIHECYVGTQVQTPNSLGEVKITWVYSSVPVQCRVIPISDRERITSPGRFDNVSYRIYFYPDVNINLGDKLMYNSEHYRIIDIHNDSSSHHRQALVAQV